MVKEMLPSYSILVLNKINPTTNDGVDIIKCTFCDLSYTPVELKSMNSVYIESADFSNIRHNQKVGSIHCSSCSRVKISRVCGERSAGNGAASDPEERNANFIKVDRGDLCSARLVSMANCRSENTDGITILEIEMNITSTNCSYNEAFGSALRLKKDYQPSIFNARLIRSKDYDHFNAQVICLYVMNNDQLLVKISSTKLGAH